MSEGHHAVGYGKPPTHTQWKPGQSGNPSGRPKKSVRLVEVLLAEANSTITITENGQTQEIAKLHAMIKSLFALAIKGDVKAQALVIKIWNPTEIAALEWYEEQSRKSLNKAIATAREILGRRLGDVGSVDPKPKVDEDAEYEAYYKAADESEKKNELFMDYDEWQKRNGKPAQYIGDT